VPTNIVQAVAGVLVTFVACWELYSKRNWFLSLSPCNRSKDEKGGETETGADDSAQTQNTAERGEAGVEVEEIGVGNGDESTEKKETTSSSTSANNAPNDDVESREEPSGKDVAATPPKTTISSVYASLAVEPDNNIDMSAAKTSTSSQTNIKPDAVQEDEERLKFGINKPTLMTLLAGGKFIYVHSIENSFSSSIQYSWQASFITISLRRRQRIFGWFSCYSWSSTYILFLTSSPPHNIQQKLPTCHRSCDNVLQCTHAHDILLGEHLFDFIG